jgi:SAM-dependent methyltransferase
MFELTVWFLALFIIILILIFLSIRKRVIHENFESDIYSKPFKVHNKENEIYDSFYSDIYDDLVYNPHKNKFEINSIIQATNLSLSSSILEVGCGTGHHAGELAKIVDSVVAIDISKHMIRKCQQTYKRPNLTFQQGNALDPILFQPLMFSHIMCFYFTIYYMKDKGLFFNNCNTWLRNKGYLVIHLVDRDRFDPVVPPSSPFMFVNPQTYAKERIMKSSVYFNDFKYNANFMYDKNKTVAVFSENFQNRATSKVFRKNDHTFYMEPEAKIVRMAKDYGFNVVAKIDLLKAGYENQFLYVFMKE